MSGGSTEEPLRVLQLMSCRGWSSDAWAAVSLTLGLQEAGHRVILVCRRGQGEKVVARAREAGVRRIEYLSFETGFSPRAWREDIRALGRWVTDQRTHVVHAHRGQDHWLAAATLRLAGPVGAGRPVLIRSRHILQPVRIHRANRWLYNRATDWTVAATEKINQGFLKTGVFRVSRFTTLRGGVDLAEFRADLSGTGIRRDLGLSATDVVFGMASSFIPVKGHLNAVEAVALLRRRNVPAHLLLAGSGGEGPVVAERARALRVDDAVHFLGYREDLPRCLAAADVGLFAARNSEGTSRVVLEWMALGKPTVATDVGCVRELFEDGREGLLVPPDEPAALARAMERLAADPSLRERLGGAARLRAENEYDRRVWTRRMVGVYRDAMNLRTAPAQPLRTAPRAPEAGPSYALKENDG